MSARPALAAIDTSDTPVRHAPFELAALCAPVRVLRTGGL